MLSINFLVFDGGLHQHNFHIYEVGGIYSCFNGYNKLKTGKNAESIILKAFSELADKLNLECYLSDIKSSSWYLQLIQKEYPNIHYLPSNKRAICFQSKTNKRNFYHLNLTDNIKKSIDNKSFLNEKLNKPQVILYHPNRPETQAENQTKLNVLYNKLINKQEPWNSGKILLKPTDLMKGFGILYIEVIKDNLNCDEFITLVIDHLTKWNRECFIIEPLFQPATISIRQQKYIPTIRHVVLVAHEDNLLLYKKHLFSYYKLPKIAFINSYSIDTIISADKS